MIDVELKYFNDNEFQGQMDKVHPGTLYRVDFMRELLGYPLFVSIAPGAVWRPGSGSSQHYTKDDGYSRALDLMSPTPGVSGEQLVEAAKRAGFTGIGYYPHWEPYHGVHVDTRSYLRGELATWGALKDSKGKQNYTDLQTALDRGRK